MSRAPRKVFPHESGSVVCAAGILLVRCTDRQGLLVNETKNGSSHLSDLGGKVEEDDETPFDTAAREFREESGYDCPADANIIAQIYNPASKYMLFVCSVGNSDIPEDGNLRWCDFKSVLPQLHPRMAGIRINVLMAIRNAQSA